ncbi:unnamed protein product, partial [marine sediment metagenome]
MYRGKKDQCDKMKEIEDKIKHYPYLRYEENLLYINKQSSLDIAE